MPKTPSYRCRTGYTQAIVTLTDSVTRKRRDYWLGPHGSPESREHYHLIIAEWEANGRRLPRLAPPAEAQPTADQLRVVVVLRDFRRWAKQAYDDGEYRSFDVLLRLLRRQYGRLPAIEFGPKKLRALREQMIRGDETTDPPRRPWSRKYINQQTQRVRRIFKWAVAHELVPASVHQALCTVEPLKRGRSAARENPRVGPVPDEVLGAVLPHLSKTMRALVDLQLLTGARAGELLQLRACDVETDDRTGVWTCRPHEHKNAYREHERIIYFGPRAQRVLQPFLRGRLPTDHLFNPTETEAERRAALHARRKTPLSCGNRPGTNRQATPRRCPGDHYTTDSYRRAIEYACDKAFPLPEALARHEKETASAWHARIKRTRKWDALKTWRRHHRFHPHQLRHSAATLLRREFGLEAAQLALGHASANITDAVYAERDREKVIEVMRKIG